MNVILVPVWFKFCACENRCGCDTPNIEYTSYELTYGRLLAAVKPSLVTEWGPGRNTAMALAAGASVLSVESQARYLHVHHPRLMQVYVSEEHERYLTRATGAEVAFVDGRRRRECILSLRHHEQSNHILVLHDAKRWRYWTALSQYEFIVVPDGTTAYATEDEDWQQLLREMFGRGLNEYGDYREITTASKWGE